jgi:hypothetical protein
VSAPIFISYSSKDQGIAETICRALEARGHTCWISCRDVYPGQNFQEAIVQALRSAQVMLLVFTSNANNSDEIKKELVLAGRHRVTVVPIRVEDVVPNDAFAYEFATRQWIDLFKDWEQEIERLVAPIGQILQTAKSPDGGDVEAAKTAIPFRLAGNAQPSRRLVITSALVAVLVVIGGVGVYLRPFSHVPAPGPSLPQQTAAATPAATPAPSPPPVASPAKPEPPAPSPPAAPAAPPPQAATPPPASPPAATPSSDEAAWQTAAAANTIAAFNDYLKAFSAGAYAEEAQLKMAELILASPMKSKTYDGRWLTTISCPAFGRAQGYTTEFSAEVRDGAYHAHVGSAGEPGSLVVDGKIVSHGAAAFFAKGLIGSTALSGGTPAGVPYFFHATAQFERTGGTGRRIEFRPCGLTFVKQ